MIRIPAWLLTALLCASVSIGALYAVSGARSWVIGDMGGVLFAWGLMPVLGVVVALVGGAVQRWRWTPGAAGRIALAATAIASVVAFVSLQRHLVGGWYRLPGGFSATRLDTPELCKRLLDDNENIAGAAQEELKRRGTASADDLVRLLADQKRRNPNYADSYGVHLAIESLAGLREPRARSFLEDMLRSTTFSVVTKGGDVRTREKVYGTRIMAQQLLLEAYGQSIDVVTREPYPP